MIKGRYTVGLTCQACATSSSKCSVSKVVCIDSTTQVEREGDYVHPRICWHFHKQEVLVVGIRRSVLRIDTTKFGKHEVYFAEVFLKCHVDKMIDGSKFVGNQKPRWSSY